MNHLNRDNFTDFVFNTESKNATQKFFPSADAISKIKEYAKIIQEANLELNLYSRKTSEHDLLIRHFLDCLVAAPMIGQYLSQQTQVFDLGSGGGFPGILLACCFSEQQFFLCEKSPKKCIYLNRFVKDLGLSNATVISDSLNSLPISKSSLVVARGFKPLSEILRLLNIQNDKGAQTLPQFILYKGRAVMVQEEIAAAEKDFRSVLGSYQVQVLPLAVPFLLEERHLLILS